MNPVWMQWLIWTFHLLFKVLIPLSTSTTAIQENSKLPDYLPEDESPEKDLGKAVSRAGAKEDGGGSWLNSAATFLTRSFYW